MQTNLNRKRIYGAAINARLLNDMISDLPSLKSASKRGSVSKEFVERIMLGVTKVNGCEMCSFYHIGESLKLGMSKEEIDSLLGGEYLGVPENELPAVLFAQHYAETIGRPDKRVSEAFEKLYGKETARDIKAYIRGIMVGNAQGNIIGSFKNRLGGRPEPGSSLYKEISVLLSGIILIPVLLIKALVMMPCKRKKQP